LPDAGPEFVAGLPVRRFHGVGPRTAEKMEKLGIITGADLAEKDEIWMRANFGSYGSYLYGAARGIDHRKVDASGVRKSIGAEQTYFEDKRNEAELREALDDIVDTVWNRIERNQGRGKTIILKARYADFQTFTRSRTIGHIFTDRAEFARIGHELLDLILPVPQGIRLLGLTLSGMVHDAPVREGRADRRTGQAVFDFSDIEAD
jgi:DNA polymerase-4